MGDSGWKLASRGCWVVELDLGLIMGGVGHGRNVYVSRPSIMQHHTDPIRQSANRSIDSYTNCFKRTRRKGASYAECLCRRCCGAPTPVPAWLPSGSARRGVAADDRIEAAVGAAVGGSSRARCWSRRRRIQSPAAGVARRSKGAYICVGCVKGCGRASEQGRPEGGGRGRTDLAMPCPSPFLRVRVGSINR